MDLQSSANTCFEQIFYTAQTALAYSVGRVAHGLANNGLTDAQRAALSPDDPEYRAAYVYLCRAPRSMSELTRLQGGRLENSSRWVDYIFGVDVVAQVVHAGILPSTYSKTGSTSVYCCNWCSCARQDGLGQRYRNPIYVGFGLVIATFLVSVITIFSACRPFHKYWQINPDPGSKFASDCDFIRSVVR